MNVESSQYLSNDELEKIVDIWNPKQEEYQFEFVCFMLRFSFCWCLSYFFHSTLFCRVLKINGPF